MLGRHAGRAAGRADRPGAVPDRVRRLRRRRACGPRAPPTFSESYDDRTGRGRPTAATARSSGRRAAADDARPGRSAASAARRSSPSRPSPTRSRRPARWSSRVRACALQPPRPAATRALRWCAASRCRTSPAWTSPASSSSRGAGLPDGVGPPLGERGARRSGQHVWRVRSVHDGPRPVLRDPADHRLHPARRIRRARRRAGRPLPTRSPPAMSFVDAATLPVAGMTAFHALVTAGRLAAGETVLRQRRRLGRVAAPLLTLLLAPRGAP